MAHTAKPWFRKQTGWWMVTLGGKQHKLAEGRENKRLATDEFHKLSLLVTVAGRRCHVLSRIGDAGLDYSRRTNKFAHHLVLDPSELPPAGPAWLLAAPSFVQSAWDGVPRVLPVGRPVPRGDVRPAVCRAWQQVAGDAGWGGVLTATAASSSAQPAVLVFRPGTDLLSLLAESLALLPPELRWAVTFSTYYTTLPVGVDCQWRCVLEDSAEAAAAKRTQGILLLDLCQPLGMPSPSAYVEAARSGRAVERAVASALPATPGIVAASDEELDSLLRGSGPAVPGTTPSSRRAEANYEFEHIDVPPPRRHSGPPPPPIVRGPKPPPVRGARPKRKTVWTIIGVVVAAVLLIAFLSTFAWWKLHEAGPTGSEKVASRVIADDAKAVIERNGEGKDAEENVTRAEGTSSPKPEPIAASLPIGVSAKNASTSQTNSGDGQPAATREHTGVPKPPAKDDPKPNEPSKSSSDKTNTEAEKQSTAPTHKHDNVGAPPAPLPAKGAGAGTKAISGEHNRVDVRLARAPRIASIPRLPEAEKVVIGVGDWTASNNVALEVHPPKDANVNLEWNVAEKKWRCKFPDLGEQDIGVFSATGDGLNFEWDPAVLKYPDVHPKVDILRYCVLRITAGESEKIVQLFKPLQCSPLSLADEKPVQLDLRGEILPQNVNCLVELLNDDKQPTIVIRKLQLSNGSDNKHLQRFSFSGENGQSLGAGLQVTLKSSGSGPLNLSAELHDAQDDADEHVLHDAGSEKPCMSRIGSVDREKVAMDLSQSQLLVQGCPIFFVAE